MSKLALVTGGSRGLGRNSALKLADKGVDVILTYQSNHKAAQDVVTRIRKKGQKAAALALDIGNSTSFDGFVESLKSVLDSEFERERINFLVNNAGLGLYASFVDTTEEQFDTLMNVHLKGTFFLTQSLLHLMHDNGRIINISSGLTRFSLPGHCAYAMMKAGVEVMTRYLAKELGERKIRVNTLAPGAIETDFGGGVVRDNNELNKLISSQTALGRAGLPDDIGDAVVMLLSDEAGWITAQRVEASGGMFL